MGGPLPSLGPGDTSSSPVPLGDTPRPPVGRGLSGPRAVLAAKIVASGVVLASGFRAVSDDDFARVVIAEQWAHAPRWDPSGTSWLPLPFWITGAAMKLSGRGLPAARATAFVLGLGAALLVYAAARWMGSERRAATAGAVVAAIFPWSARLGVATVPELLTAALSLLAVAALVRADEREDGVAGDGGRRLAGGAALLAATLSRYETWPMAAVFAAWCVIDAVRSPSVRARALAGAGLALAGPVTWMAWNRLAHHDALHFLARVAAYRRALGGSEGGSPGGIFAYPAAMIREEPEIVALFVGAVLITAFGEGGRVLRARLRRWDRPAAVVAVQIAALSVAMLKDAAPTHHAERAVLATLLLVALAGGVLAVQAMGSGARAWKGLALAGAVVLAAWAGRFGVAREGFGQRADEEAIGRAAGVVVPPGERVLIEVVDYGFLAVEAGLGRPEDAVRDRSVDPRDAAVPSSFDEVAALRQRLSDAGACWAAARVGEPVRAVMGAPVEVRGAWGLFRAQGPR